MAASKPGVSFEKEPLRYLDQILPTVGDAFWLSRGSLIVADATAAKAVLANEDHLYQEHSDFFHTRRGQFGPRTVQVEMGRTARRMLRDHLTAQRPALPETLSRVLGSESEWPEAANRLIEPVLYFKGFHAIQTHRLAHWMWRRGRRDFALYLQSRSSEVFQTDIHPAVPFGEGIFLDHATALVIGETAVVEGGVSILQGVT
ncbi:MAG TPA: hypothetical protein PK413_16130, partial [Thermoanaerobaculia bacterium]|nr:hypothetical protein [Thermoanaerobaculia bacterium]